MKTLTPTNGSRQAVERELDGFDVRQWMPQRVPVLLLDQAQLHAGRKRLTGLKAVPQNEPFLDGHFPEYPIYPGIWILEALKQAGECLVRLADPKADADPAYNATRRYHIVESWIKHLRPVHPGETMTLEAELTAIDGDRYTINVSAHVAGDPAGKGRVVLRGVAAEPVALRGS